jgi:hypothetical protein
MAPTTRNGIAIINNTLGLNARPNESLNVAFQPGQANDAVGVTSAMPSMKKIKKLVGVFVVI